MIDIISKNHYVTKDCQNKLGGLHLLSDKIRLYYRNCILSMLIYYEVIYDVFRFLPMYQTHLAMNR